MKKKILNLLAGLGPLRIALVGTGLLVIVFHTSPEATVRYDTWGFIYTVLLPVLAPMVFMLLMLDALMSRVFMGDTEDVGEKQRFKSILLTNLITGAALLVAWAPFFLSLGR